jgi:hypothetical protein
MPSHKNLKKLIRARMSKTGESYSTARRHVMANAGGGPVSAGAAMARPPHIDSSVGLDDAVEKMDAEFRAVLAKMNPAKELQEMLAKMNPAKELQEMLAKMNPAKELQEMLAKMNPAKELQEMLAKAERVEPQSSPTPGAGSR